MNHATTRLTVSAILLAFGPAGVCDDGGGVIEKAKDCIKDVPPYILICGPSAAVGWILWDKLRGKGEGIPPPKLDKDGIAHDFEDAVYCVYYYYKSIMERNHTQYQFCVVEPIDAKAFQKKIDKRLEEMRKDGIKQSEKPVRTRSEIKDNSATVYAISPWTNKEVKYIVIKQGKSWKIKKEK